LTIFSHRLIVLGISSPPGPLAPMGTFFLEQKMPDPASDICIRLQVLNAQRQPLGGTVNIEFAPQEVGEPVKVNDADASKDIDVSGLQRTPQGLYQVTVTPTNVFKPLSQFLTIPASGFNTVQFIIPVNGGTPMPRPSQIESLANLLQNQQALQEIGSKIVRAALARTAVIAGIGQIANDPPWDDQWNDGGSGWDNHWSDDGGGNPHWEDASPGWTNIWDNGPPVGVTSIFSQNVQPFFSHQLNAQEIQILTNLKIIAPTTAE
jgi:hypothetical protein